ncbi:Helix-turn-helix domain-containing protein [Sulfitobacter brevis]|uniref:Helix-turn-helix domain-containing protein n=2 Tax=Sulfitobacter brevis TaxID=74348 RepID=A0A1I1WNH7_9RHOB|nr:Helix-turn-helix domain-containing protein [Sulfitobacter brevis]
MQNRMKRCATVLVLAIATTAVLPGTAVADRAIVKQSVHKHGAMVKIVKRQRHRHAVGHRFRKQDVVVVKNWRNSTRWRNIGPAKSRKVAHFCSGDWCNFSPALTVFVAEEKHITASGGTATADLMLHLIERDHGYDLSVAVADQMVYNAVRNATSAQRFSLQSRNGMRNAHLARALELMRDNLDEPIPPSNIARKVGISTRQSERLFGKYLNSSPKKYYLEMRLERARHRLLQTEMSVIDIAICCGFQSPGHFSRVFRTAFGVTPMMQRGRLG